MTVKHGIQRKRGMTLVELLVAISIIAILAGILIPVIRSAMMRGQVASVKMEIASLTTALEGHKLEYGGYPPDGSNPALVIQHFRNMFKRADAVEQAILAYLVTTYGLDPAESLVFFLGGFSDNPLKPLTGPGGPFSGNRKSGMMDFDPNRVTSTGQVSVLSVPLQGGNTIDIKVVASNDTDNDPFPTTPRQQNSIQSSPSLRLSASPRKSIHVGKRAFPAGYRRSRSAFLRGLRGHR